ncbi:Rhodanese-like protein [Hypoxylon sp. FL1150]|nr:Rhodanese-like protein [Hypoxylon sp. FL1150]
MASRRIALSAALRGRCSTTTAAPQMLRAAFSSTAPSSASRITTLTKATIARPNIGRSGAAHGGRSLGVRWSSDTPAGTKIWSFEEIQALTSNPDTPDSTKPKILLIDSREPSELAQTGRIPGALNVPVASAPDSFHVPTDEFEMRYGTPRPDPDETELVFYCKAGVRSRAAATIAREAGYKKVGEYPGSWVDWVGKGGKVERREGEGSG